MTSHAAPVTLASSSGLAVSDPSGRGRAALAGDWWPRALPGGTTAELVTLVAADGEVSRGMLYERGTSDVVVCLMHPRADVTRHPAIVGLLEAGVAVWTHAGRDVNNDLRLVHESALLDVAAGQLWLRRRGFESVVLLGMSGGAALYSYYAEQALAQPADRIERAPAGRPTRFAEAEMPAPDLLALVAPHPGQGLLLLGMIDPSVTDESNPLSLDPSLDPFDPDNGFRPGPEGASYSREFIARYRAAQRARVERIDARARDLIDAQLTARKRFKQRANSGDLRLMTMAPIIVTYRTDADLRSMDLGLDASGRSYGSVISARPEVSNYGVLGFGRLTTPEAWLSTWSGLSSHAATARCARAIELPTLVVEYKADQSVFPTDIQAVLDALAGEDVTHLAVDGDHFGQPAGEARDGGTDAMVGQLLKWLEARVSR